MSNLVPFEFDTHQIRVNTDDPENTLWQLSDLCFAFGLTNPSEVVKRLQADEYVTLREAEGGGPPRIFINEKGLYRLIFRSNKPEAIRFQNWVLGEVLPRIRKTGKYEIVPTEAFDAQTKLLSSATTRIQTSLELDALFKIPPHVTLTEECKEIHAELGIDLSQKLLASPYMQDIQPEEEFLEIADLSKALCLPNVRMLNPLLVKVGWQVKAPDGSWQPTDESIRAGRCRRHKWITKTKEGFNWIWRKQDVERLLQQRGGP